MLYLVLAVLAAILILNLLLLVRIRSNDGLESRVRAELERQVKDLGINYLLTYLFLGTMTLKDAMRSLELFRTEVMPHVEKL